ncbi:MAG: ribosome recycling factor [candidate division WOR-3 bacterium]
MDVVLKKQMVEKMEKTLSIVSEEFASIKTGRASPALLEGIKVDYYGTKVPINQLASITVPEPHLIVIHPFDEKAIDNIEKAIVASELGLNPSNDGSVLRIPIPPLTDERREELKKLIHRLAENGRVSLRNIRRDFIKIVQDMEKEKKISKDDELRYKEEIQKITDHFSEKINELLKKKEKEIFDE